MLTTEQTATVGRGSLGVFVWKLPHGSFWTWFVEGTYGECIKVKPALFWDLCPIIHHGFQKMRIQSWELLYPLQPSCALSPGNQDCCAINCFAYDNSLFWCLPLGIMSWDSTCGCCSFHSYSRTVFLGKCIPQFAHTVTLFFPKPQNFPFHNFLTH